MPSSLTISLTFVFQGNTHILVLHAVGTLKPGREGLENLLALNHRLTTALAPDVNHGVVLNFLGLDCQWGDAVAALWTDVTVRHGIPVVIVAEGETRRALEELVTAKDGVDLLAGMDSLVAARDEATLIHALFGLEGLMTAKDEVDTMVFMTTLVAAQDWIARQAGKKSGR